jgi:hypothetical protein
MLALMFVTRIMIVSTIALMTLTGNGACLVDAGNEDENLFAVRLATKMFGDGLVHDFGKVQRGTQARHAFRIVNTSRVPLRIVSLRCS